MLITSTIESGLKRKIYHFQHIHIQLTRRKKRNDKTQFVGNKEYAVNYRRLNYYQFWFPKYHIKDVEMWVTMCICASLISQRLSTEFRIVSWSVY